MRGLGVSRAAERLRSPQLPSTFNHLTAIHLPNDETGEPSETASYAWIFDAASQVLSETDPLGRVLQHEYDNLGREIATITNDPDGAGPLEAAVFRRGFDAASRVIETFSPKNQSVQFEYDLLDNIISENWFSSADTPATLSVETSTTGQTVDEVQRVGYGSIMAVSGTFTLSFDGQTTGDIAANASTSTIKGARQGLSTIGSGNVAVSDTSGVSNTKIWQLSFMSALAGANLSQVTVNGAGLLPTGHVSTYQFTDTQGASDNEVQVVTLDGATGGTFTLTFDAQTIDPIPFDASAETVESALADLSSVGSGNVSVSGSAGGPWTVTFGSAIW